MRLKTGCCTQSQSVRVERFLGVLKKLNEEKKFIFILVSILLAILGSSEMKQKGVSDPV